MSLATGALRPLAPAPGCCGDAAAYSPSGRVLFNGSATGAIVPAVFAEAPAGRGLVQRLARTGRSPRLLMPR